jgi:hypothetical protein
MVSFNTHVSGAQVTIGLITVLYNFTKLAFILSIYSKHHIKPTYSLSGQNSESRNVKPGGAFTLTMCFKINYAQNFSKLLNNYLKLKCCFSWISNQENMY